MLFTKLADVKFRIRFASLPPWMKVIMNVTKIMNVMKIVKVMKIIKKL